MRRRVGIVAALLLFACPGSAHAASPRQDWRTLDSEHFRFHFHPEVEALARRLVPVGEEALRALSSVLAHLPKDLIHVVVTDETDSANGFASVTPQNNIHLFAAVPEPFTTLGDYDDAMRLLFIHELAHVVHLDTIGGVSAWFNAVFGKTLAPNQVQPRWFIEGLAVWAESHFTRRGRVRNSLIDMYLRQDFLADAFLDIDQLSAVTRRFPGSSLHWSYGGRFLDFIQRRHGIETLGQVSALYGGRLVPYGLNLAAREVTGEDFLTLWDEFRESERSKVEVTLARIRGEGLRLGEVRASDAEEHYVPAYAPDGTLAFVRSPRDDDGELVFLSPGAGARDAVHFRISGGAGSFAPDGRYVYSVGDTYQQRFSFADLEIFDGERRKRRTLGARLSEPNVAADGTIVAVAQSAGETDLVTLSLNGEDGPSVLYSPPPGHHISGPSWSPDGRQIALSLHTPNGGRCIVVLDRDTEQQRRLTDDLAQALDPVWTTDGRAIVYAADREGVFNLHAVAAVGEVQTVQITNVETGAFQPAMEPDGKRVTFVHGEFTGSELRSIELPEPLFKSDGQAVPCADSSATNACPREGWDQQTFDAREDASDDRIYRPWETLLPQAWLPTTGQDGVGTTFGVFVSGTDAVNAHRYDLRVQYGIQSQRIGYSINYRNSMMPTGIFIDSSLQATTRAGRFLSPARDVRPESIFRLRAGIDLPFNHWDSGQGLSFSYAIETRRGLRLGSLDPFQEGPPQGASDLMLGSFAVNLRFSNTRSYADSNTNERGHAFGLAVEAHDPRIGSDLRLLTVSATWQGYQRLPWLRHHVLAARLSLGVATGDARGRSAFGLGGLVARNILADGIENSGTGNDVIRGYPPDFLRGSAYYASTIEYRAPLFTLSRGLDTLPVFLDRGAVAVFFDIGDTPNASLRFDAMRAGVGAEARVDLVFGYYMNLTLRLGYARGLRAGGLHNPYVVLGGPF